MSQQYNQQSMYNQNQIYNLLYYTYTPQQGQNNFIPQYQSALYPNQQQFGYVSNNNNGILPNQLFFINSFYPQGLYSQINPQFHQINIGNTYHQVNYNVNQNEIASQKINSIIINQPNTLENENTWAKNQNETKNKPTTRFSNPNSIFKEFPVIKESIINQKGDITNTVINKVDIEETNKDKDFEIIKDALTQTKENEIEIRNLKEDLAIKEEKESENCEEKVKKEFSNNVNNEGGEESNMTKAARKRKRTGPKKKGPQLVQNESSNKSSNNKNINKIAPHNKKNNNTKELSQKSKQKETNVQNSNQTQTFEYHPGIQTRTSLHNAMLKDSNNTSATEPLEVFLYNNLDNHLSDSFFDLVNNKKHTKKYRELNYVQTKTPEEFMDINFIQKLKEKPEPRAPIVPCEKITKFDIESKIKTPEVIVTWNPNLFKAKNPKMKVEDVLTKIEEKWPKKIIDFWHDRALQFLALCNYNVDLSLQNITEGSKSNLFMNYADKINKETKDNFTTI